MKTALGLKPDSSANKLQINFCCLTSKYYIWLCHSKEQVPTEGNYLQFLKQIYQMEKNTTAAKQNGNLFCPPYNLNHKSPKHSIVYFIFYPMKQS